MIPRKNLWRGRLLPLGCAATLKIASATHWSGSKLHGHKSLFQALVVVSLFGLSACTVGPDFHKPETTQIADWAKPAKSAPSQVVSEPLNERWWDVFRSEEHKSELQSRM